MMEAIRVVTGMSPSTVAQTPQAQQWLHLQKTQHQSEPRLGILYLLPMSGHAEQHGNPSQSLLEVAPAATGGAQCALLTPSLRFSPQCPGSQWGECRSGGIVCNLTGLDLARWSARF
ncbi:TPA: hypothetical protein ACH3X1_009682 [Trebouxia sp. C0004]